MVSVEKAEENEKSVDISNVPIFNKFETIQNYQSDPIK